MTVAVAVAIEEASKYLTFSFEKENVSKRKLLQIK